MSKYSIVSESVYQAVYVGASPFCTSDLGLCVCLQHNILRVMQYTTINQFMKISLSLKHMEELVGVLQLVC